jgi:hypothetical protein
VGASLEAIRAKRVTKVEVRFFPFLSFPSHLSSPSQTKPAAAAKGAQERKAKVASVKRSQKSQKLKAVMAQQKTQSAAKAGGLKGMETRLRRYACSSSFRLFDRCGQEGPLNKPGSLVLVAATVFSEPARLAESSGQYVLTE